MPRQSDRRGDFMQEPKGGWLHDSGALAHGAGCYYSFPVKYLGSIQVLKSLRELDINDKTETCREGIARCINASKVQRAVKTKVPKRLDGYLADAPYVKVMDLKLNISTEGIATSAIGSMQIISNDPIQKISFATGGTSVHYQFITYVAKDRRENRYCHVFDCASLADDVLATLGQVFHIITSVPQVPPPMLRPASSSGGGGGGASAGGGGFAQAPALPPNHPSLKKGTSMDFVPSPNAPKVASRTDSIPMVRDILTYDDGEESYGGVPKSEEMADLPTPPRPAAPKPVATELEVYEAMQSDELVKFLNDKKPPAKLVDTAEDQEVYGDGQVGWSYLDVKLDTDLYGTLADVVAGGM